MNANEPYAEPATDEVEAPLVARFPNSPWVMSNILTHPYYNRVAATIKWDREDAPWADGGTPTSLDMELGETWLSRGELQPFTTLQNALERETGHDFADSDCPDHLSLQMQVLLQVWIWDEASKTEKTTLQTILNKREDRFNAVANEDGKSGPAPWKDTLTMRKGKRKHEGCPLEKWQETRRAGYESLKPLRDSIRALVRHYGAELHKCEYQGKNLTENVDFAHLDVGPIRASCPFDED